MRSDRRFLVAVACLAAGVLTLQIVLTRIFSVTTQYHFAFLSVSLALFGLAAGGLVVRLWPSAFGPERAERRIAETALVASFGTPVLLAAVDALRLSPKALFVFLLLPAVPFTSAGIALAAAYTRRAEDAGRVYAADHAGAALGCLIAAPLLALAGGPAAMVLAATLPALAALLLGGTAHRALAAAWLVGIVALSAGAVRGDLFRVTAFKNPWDAHREYEAWNSFSRVAVMPMPEDLPLGWGMDALPFPEPPPLKLLNIDADAATLLVGAGTGEGALDFIGHDLTAFALGDLPTGSHVLVVGAGGGKDVLASLDSGAERVTAVEVNPLIVHTVNDVYGDFTGRPYSHPDVDLVVADARTFLASDDGAYDRIVLGLVDSWSATASGAFILTENHLYTREAFATYLERLGATGIASISRWFFPDHPSETLRTAVTARVVLEDAGVERPLDHLVVLARRTALAENLGVGVVLMSKAPFGPERTARIVERAEAAGVTVVHPAADPATSPHATFLSILAAPDLDAAVAAHPLDVSPVPDDRPFFFQALRLRDVANAERVAGLLPHATFPLYTLGLLCVLAAVLAAGVVLGPLLLTPGRRRAVLGALAPFAGLGAAYFFVEVALVERMVLLIGDPTRALALVLGSLLVGTALGGFSTRRVATGALGTAFRKRSLAALGAAVVLVLALAPAAEAALARPGLTRLPVAALVCFATGFVLGRPFPIALRALADRAPDLVPWAWATNGALGVAASVFSIPIAMAFGFRAVLVAGALAYAYALVTGPRR